MKKYCLVVLMALVGVAWGQEESFNCLWGTSYFEQGIDKAVAVFQFGDSLLVFGSHRRPSTSNFDQMLLWLDLDGNILDTTITLTSPDRDLALHAFLNPAGNIIMCGYSLASDDTNGAFAAELTITGDIVWWRNVTIPVATVVELDQGCRKTDGSYFFVGHAMGIPPYGDMRPLYVHCDATGALLAADTIGIIENVLNTHEALAVAPTQDGGVVIGGYSFGYLGRLLKLNAENQVEWRRWIWGNFSLSVAIRQIIELPNGDLLVGGDSEGPNDNHDLMMARTNSNGDEIWYTGMPGDEREQGSTLLPIREGRFLIAAVNTGSQEGNECVTLATVEPNGIAHTFEVIDDDGQYEIRSIGGVLQLPDCTIVIAGSGYLFHGTGIYYPGFYVARYSPDRREYCPPQPFSLAWPENGDTVSLSPINFRWLAAHDADPFDTVRYGIRFWNRFGEFSVDSLIDTTYDVTRQQFRTMGGDTFYWDVTASSSRPETTITSEGAFWFRLGPILDLDETPSLPQQFDLSFHPNPFNTTTSITLSLPHSSPVEMVVYNTLGQQVLKTDLGWLNSGQHRLLFDGSELSSGVYLAHFQFDQVAITTKIILLK